MESTLQELLQQYDWNVDTAEAAFHLARAQTLNRRQLDKKDNHDTHTNTQAQLSGSPDCQPSNTTIGGPRYLGGRTIVEHVADINSTEDQQEIDAVRSLPTQFRGWGIPYRGSVDLERRLVVVLFRDLILEEYDIKLSRAEAALVLGLSHFNISKAFDEYSRVEQLRALLSEYFDHLREIQSGLTVQEQQSEKDRRLTLLLTFTARPDLYSCQIFLEKNKNDLVRAIGEWVRTGIEPHRHLKDKTGKAREGEGRREDFSGARMPLPLRTDTFGLLENDNPYLWAPLPAIFMTEQRKARINTKKFLTTSTGSWKYPFPQAPRKMLRSGDQRTRCTGAIINHNAAPSRIDTPDHTLFKIESVQNGKYRINMYSYHRIADSGETRTEADGGTRRPADTRSLFDWADADHHEKLRKWRNQCYGRITGSVLREGQQKLTISEKRFLYNLWAQAWRNHETSNPGKTELQSTTTTPLRISKSLKTTWGNSWNTRFAGKPVEGEAKLPRRKRTGENLLILSKRWTKLCQEFGLTEDTTGARTDETIECWPWELSAAEQDVLNAAADHRKIDDGEGDVDDSAAAVGDETTELVEDVEGGGSDLGEEEDDDIEMDDA